MIALVGFTHTLLPGGSVFAGHAAIAWDHSGKIGSVWNQPMPKKAAEMASSQCGTSGCRLVIKPTTACAAVASTENGK